DLIPDEFVVDGGSLVGNVLKNDSDVDGDSLMAQLQSAPSKGVLSLSSDGSFDYKQNAGAEGQDEFVYSVSNRGGNVSRKLFTYSSEWAYLDDGSNQGSSWTGVDFDDSAWSVGAGEFGYGEGDENTVISYGSNSNNRHVTTYFRKQFYLRDPDSVNSMVIGLVRNDACAVFLNGKEVYRDSNLNDNAAYNVLSSTDLFEEDYKINVAVPVFLIRDGVNVLAVEVHKSSRSSARFSFNSSATAIIPPFTRIFSSGESWAYLDNGTYPGNDWDSLNFDDSTWKAAKSPLGYGDDAVVGNVGFGDDSNNKHSTTYFRKSFKFLGASEVVSSKIRIRKDDGVAVYLNGKEIVRDNLSTDAGNTTFADSTIGGDDELEVKEYVIDSSLLVDGDNVISAEVHQANASSSDLFFDAEFFVSIGKIREFVSLDLIDAVAGKDTDEDGWFDETEVFFRSSPTDPDSVPMFQLKSIVLEDGQVQYMFPAEQGSGYVIQASNDLQTWMTLKKLIVGRGNIATERFSPTGKRHFYRIRKQ
ncbi:MAG: Ig-like domain-containing protein, partial [Akkermansiaceae bacterium]|nr:Ig-like domain-containing protein [Akkermansiaceae bacterium]